MAFITPTAPHLHHAFSVSQIMGMVLLALLPAVFVQSYFFGPGLSLQLCLAAASGLTCEALALYLRGKPIITHLMDGSVLITAALLAMSIPPLAPWWLVVSATAFAVLLGKHAYGGLGSNPFNPAMLGYAVLLVSFPRQMTSWLPAANVRPIELSFGQTAHAIFTGQLPEVLTIDMLSGASPLAALKTGLSLRQTMDEIFAQPMFGSFAGQGWQCVSAALLLGGLLLLALRVIRWQIPTGVLLGLGSCAWLMNLADPGQHAGVIFHLFSGATMLCAFFIATDPVSAATSPRGRLIYGIGIGVLSYVIRDFGNYHDGVAFAVLLMNLAVPLIDKFTIPRIYGEPS
jgi:electron transport complex protein RnfD